MTATLNLRQYPIDLDQLPETWRVGAVGEFALELRPGFASGAHNADGDGIPHLRPMNVSRSGSVDLSQVKYVDGKNPLRIEAGDVLFNNTNSPELIGKTAHFSGAEPLAFSNHMTRIRLPESLDGRFVAHQLHYLWMSGYFLHNCVNHVNQASVSTKTLASFVPLVVPSLSEQRRIVEVIETQLTRLDVAVAALKRAQANLKRYRASVLKAAVEGRLVSTEAELARQEGRDFESGQDRLRKSGAKLITRPAGVTSPEGWGYSSIGEIAKVGTGATPLRSNSTYYEGGSIPWVTSGALNMSTVAESKEYVTSKALSETNLKLYPPGTLLVAMYGEGKTRGKCSELLIPATTNQAIAAIVINEDFQESKRFLHLFLDSNYEDTRRAASGGVQPNLNLSLIKSIVVPMPPLAEQRRIVEDVEKRIDEIELQERILSQAFSRALRLRQSILRNAFRGNLGQSMLPVTTAGEAKNAN